MEEEGEEEGGGGADTWRKGSAEAGGSEWINSYNNTRHTTNDWQTPESARRFEM